MAALTDDAPADPISPEDLADFIGVIERMPTRKTENNISHDRLLAMLLLRNTRLRISDVVRFSTGRFKGECGSFAYGQNGQSGAAALPSSRRRCSRRCRTTRAVLLRIGSCKHDTATGNARVSAQTPSPRRTARVRTGARRARSRRRGSISRHSWRTLMRRAGAPSP